MADTTAVTINTYKKAYKKNAPKSKADDRVPATVLDRAREEAKNDALIEKVWGKLKKKK